MDWRVACVVAATMLAGGCALYDVDRPPGQAALERYAGEPVSLERPPDLGRTARAGAPVPGELGPPPAVGADDLAAPEIAAPVTPPGEALAGDGPLRLSVEQAVVLALRNNRSLAAERLGPVIAGTFEDIERAVYDPVVFAEGQYSREEREQVDRATGSLFSVAGDGHTVLGGVSRLFPTGTDVQVDLTQSRSESSRTPEQYETRLGLTLTQALLRGADVDANLARVRQAEADTLASMYELRGFTEALVAEVEATFWDLVLARRSIGIFEESLALAEQQMRETQQRIDVGQLAETELAAAEAEVALRRQGLIDARSTLEQARLRLLQLMSPQSAEGWDRPVEPADAPEPLTPPADRIEDRVALALALRPDLNQARLAVQRDELEVVATRNGLLPRLDFFVTLGKTGYAESFGGSIEGVTGPGYDVAAGLRFEFPVGNRAAEARHRGARASRAQAARSLENLAQLVTLDVRTAQLEVDRTRQLIAASAATRAAQEEVVRAELAKFRVGNSTALLVAQAQRDLLEARIGEIEAIVAHRQGLIELYRLEGSLLKRRGIAAPGDRAIEVQL